MSSYTTVNCSQRTAVVLRLLYTLHDRYNLYTSFWCTRDVSHAGKAYTYSTYLSLLTCIYITDITRMPPCACSLISLLKRIHITHTLCMCYFARAYLPLVMFNYFSLYIHVTSYNLYRLICECIRSVCLRTT